MIRGLKKKLLIGLLSAAVVGTSLAPNVPLVGSFAQEVKANAGDEVVAADGVYVEEAPASAEVDEPAHWSVDGQTYNGAVYKKVGDNYNKADQPESADGTEVTIEASAIGDGDTYNGETTYYKEVNGNYNRADVDAENFNDMKNDLFTIDESKAVRVDTTPATYKWSKEVAGKYTSSDEKTFSLVKDQPAAPTGLEQEYPTGNTKLYSKKTGASVATIKESENATTKGYSVEENNKNVALEKNKDETVKVTVTAGVGKVIKNVIAKILDSNGNVKQSLTATAVEAETDVYRLTVKATEDVINLIVDAETETLKITPTLDTSALSSKVGTASLASSSPVEYGNKITLTVNLAEGRTATDVVVTSDAGIVSRPEKDGSVLTYKIDTTGVTKDSIKITITGQLENDDLDKEAKKDGSEATVTNASGKKVAADANQVLEAAKAGNEGKNVKAALKIEEKTDNVDPVLTNNVSSRLTLDTDLNLAGYFAIDLYRVVVDAGETIPDVDITTGENAAKNKVTTLDSLLTVHYFLPSNAVGKKLYKVVRNHDGIGDITTTPNEDGEYIEVDGNKLTLHVKNLSDFAVLYSTADATTPDTPDNPDTPNNQDNPGGTITPSNGTTATTNTAKAATSTKAAKVTTSTKKSTKTSSPKTADYAVNSLLALLTGAAGLFGITLVNKKRKEDE
ncbi:hypothetical protein [Lachnobacterium bovis]|uniref:hypothetical protein n=1 Tax=Lachnobacterium bovis TaxID=140626 RepID=UPI000490CCEE|nr:hypothetical protein [Lachnobacterium bovis]